MKKVVCYLMLALFLLCPIETGTANAKEWSGTFIDTQGHWAKSDIEATYNHGLMQGTGTNKSGFKTFAPEEKVNRFQLAAVIKRTFDLDYGNMQLIEEPKVSDYYYDLKDDAWYSESVISGVINHIFAPNNEFKGEEEVSRIEVATSIYNAFQSKGINVPMIMLMPLYNDTAKLTQEEVNAMVFVSNTGIMKGNNNLFRPYDSIKRAELARVLNQCVKLIEMNTVEVDPIPAVKPDTEGVKNDSNAQIITAYGNNDVTVYRNGEYGFSFSLPERWQGYSIITDKWEGIAPASTDTEENGPLISLRHPQWTAQNPRQDIPIMVLTHNQWNLLQQRKLGVGAAPIPPKELGRNTKYVFALPARYNYAFPTGYEEVEKILENNPLKAF